MTITNPIDALIKANGLIVTTTYKPQRLDIAAVFEAGFQYDVTVDKKDNARQIAVPYRMGLGHSAFYKEIKKLRRYKTVYNAEKLQFEFATGKSALNPNHRIVPKTSDVVWSILSDATAAHCSGYDFTDFCGDYGLNEDSIKARETFLACQEIAVVVFLVWKLDQNEVAEAIANY